MAKRTIYRDSSNGQFASKRTWKQSKKRGGKRYKRERINYPKKKKKVPPPPPPPPPQQTYEYVVAFTYDKTGRSFDVIVTARSEAEAFSVAAEFLSKDTKGQNITRAKFQGWSYVPARGRATNKPPGEAEYRDKSREEEDEEEDE